MRYQILLVGFCLLFNSLVTAEEEASCPCGCVCSDECDCGSAEGEENCSCALNGNNVKPEPIYQNGMHVQYENDTEHAYLCGCCGTWFPEEPTLFRPFIADPRQVTYSVGWRFFDQALAHRVVDVSFGDIFPIYRWANVWPFGGELSIELEGCVWAVFAPLEESAPLIDADYYCSINTDYAFDNWAFRLRFFHISTHIGDEFLINHLPKGFRRKNPSYEFLDFFASWDFTDDLRFYGGIGYIVDMDESFKVHRLYGACGMEVRPWGISYTDWCHWMYGVPIFGMHFRFSEDFKHHMDATYVLGYEWGKLTCLERRLRVFLEYHDGYSLEGQFSRFATNYFSIRASYGF